MATFSKTVRDAIDPDRLAGKLLHAVDMTVQSEFVGLWLRTPEREGSR